MTDEIADVQALLEMIGSVLREHTDTSNPGVHVLPCLSNDLAADIGTLNSAVHAAGGSVLNTTRHRADQESAAEAMDYRTAVPGAPSPALTTLLGIELRLARAGGDCTVEISVDKQCVDARYVAATTASAAAPVPSSKDPVLAIVRALCSQRLSQHQLAVIVYDEDELDVGQKDAVWRLSAHLRGLTIGSLRTLVILAGASVNLARHVQHETGFRLARQAGQLITRHPPRSLNAAVADIVRSAAPFVGLFLGAGFSASSGLALGNSLRDAALRDLDQSAAGAGPHELACDFYRWLGSQDRLLDSERGVNIDKLAAELTLERVLREEFRSFAGEDPPTLARFAQECGAAKSRIGGAPVALARMLATPRRLVLCTVNFDELIETAAPGRCRVFATDDDFHAAADHLDDYLAGGTDEAPLWKLHGTISNIDSCVASDDQTLIGLSDPKRAALEHVLGAATSPVPWFYVGASMRDTDLVPLLGQPEFVNGLREHWVLPHTIDTVRTFVDQHRTERWDANKLPKFEERLITETADAFLSVLSDRWTAAAP